MRLFLLCASVLFVAIRSESELLSRCFNADEIALTFEGGPDAQKTPLVLDALKRYNATATFFLRAVSLDSWPAIKMAKRIVDEGHTIGLLLEPTMEQREDISIEVLASSIQNHIDIIDKTIGKRPKFLRANYANTTTKFGGFLNSNGYICTVPAIDANDLVLPTPQSPLKAILNALPLQSSPIIRLHDTASLTANMAKDIIEHMVVRTNKRLVDIVNCTGMGYAYEKSQVDPKEVGKGAIGDRPLDMSGNLFAPPPPAKNDWEDEEDDDGTKGKKKKDGKRRKASANGTHINCSFSNNNSWLAANAVKLSHVLGLLVAGLISLSIL